MFRRFPCVPHFGQLLDADLMGHVSEVAGGKDEEFVCLVDYLKPGLFFQHLCGGERK